MLKKYINKYTIQDVPQNGVIISEKINNDGEKIDYQTGVSNLPFFFKKNMHLANKNGYYEYIEGPKPEYNEELQSLEYEYFLEDNIITKIWIITAKINDEVTEDATDIL